MTAASATETTTPRIDLDNFSTAATRELAKNRDGLLTLVNGIRETATATAETMTMASLKAVVELPARDPKSATKAQWVEAYADQEVSRHPAQQALEDLNEEASADRWIATTINGLMNRADQARKDIDDLGKIHDSSKLKHLRDALIDIEAGRLAAEIVAAVNGGAELRRVCVAYLVGAMKTVFRHAAGNGMATESEAMGANWFRDRMIEAMAPAKVTIPVDMFL